MLSDPQGLSRLRQLGARSVPVVAQGDRHVWAQNLRVLAEFMGMLDRLQAPLPPDDLVNRWLAVLGAARRYVRQLTRSALQERVIPARDRNVRMLSFHAFRIADGFLDAVEAGWTHDPFNLELADSETGFQEPGEIAAYGDAVMSRLAQWRARLTPAQTAVTLAATMATISGPQSVIDVLERSTWHSAQHVRQLQFVLERSGIAPDGPLTPQDLAGLPLPERLFE